MLPSSVPLSSKLILLALLVAGWSTASNLAAQPFSQGQCTVSVLNQTANVLSDGTWNLPNVPSNMGAVRARVTCEDGDQVLSGASDFFEIVPDRMNAIPRIELGSSTAVPESITLDLPVITLTSPGQTVQAVVTARFADGATVDVTPAESGTTYLTSSPEVATVGPDGRITAVGSGRTLVAVLHEAILDSVLVTAILSPDSDGDGLPDDFELSIGLDPQDPVDALEDLDEDGLNNLREFELGTRLDDGDSDGDGVADGEEVASGRDGFVTNPLLADSDGDGVRDGLELSVGTDPTDRASVDYEAVLVGLRIEPPAFTLINNTLLPDETSRRVRVTGLMIDETEADLTSRPEVVYRSSALQVANLGAEPGRIFAGEDGTAVVSATLAGLSGQVDVQVTTVSPRALAFLPIPGFANGVAAGQDIVYVAAGTTGLHIVDVSDPGAPFILSALDTPGNANDVRAEDGLVYVADGDEGLQIVDTSLPTSPTLVGSVDTPGNATDLALDADLALIADGEAGVAVVDVSDPSNPRILAQLDTPGNARGIDAEGGVAVIADATGGFHVVDLTDPAAPFLVGSTHTRGTTSRAADVVLRGRRAYVADGSNATLGGIKVIDLTDPTTPAVVGATGDRFGLTGIALDRNLALASDYFFVNAVPAFDIRQDTPTFRGALDFSDAPSFRDDNGNGIAVRGGLVFLAGTRREIQDNGTSADSGLHIGRYAILGDDLGVAPEVELTAPTSGTTVFERRLLTFEATASDDILVDAVTFLVNGEPVGGDFSPPYTLDFSVPGAVVELVVQAVAADLGGNQTISEATVVTVLADTVPSARIVSPTSGSSVVEGSTVFASVSAGDDDEVVSVELLVDGTVTATDTSSPFRFPVPVPLGTSELTLTATAFDTLGQSTTSEAVVLAVVPDRPPTVEIVEPLDGNEVIEGDRVRLVAGAADDLGGVSVRFFVNGVEVEEDIQEPFEHELAVPTGVGEVTVSAEAKDSAGQTTASAEIALPVISDPGTTLVGSLVTEDGTPVAGATVTALEVTSSSLADGTFRLENVPTILGDVQVRATASTATGVLQGSSAFVTPVPGGVVDVGTVLMEGQSALGMVVDNATDSVVVFDGGTHTVLGSVSIRGNAIGDCSVTADQKLGFVTTFSSFLWVIDLTTTPPSLAPFPNPIFISNAGEDTSITPDEQFVVVCDGGFVEPVSVVDIEARREVFKFFLQTSCNSVDVCRDGSVLVTSSRDDVLRRLTIDGFGTLSDTGESLKLPGDPNNVLCAPDGARGVVIQDGRNQIDGQEVIAFTISGLTPTSQTLMSGSRGISGTFGPSGKKLYTRSHQPGAMDLFAFDPLSGLLDSSPQWTVPLADTINFFGMDQLAVSPDGTKVYVSQPGALNVYDALTGTLVDQITHPALVEPTGVCFPRQR